MRLARLVAAGLVLGAVVGFVAALVRPRGHHPEPLPGRGQAHAPSGPASGASYGASSGRPAGPRTRPLSLPAPPALSGTGGHR